MGKKILVVDDDDSVRKSITGALKLKGGFDILEAEDGLSGLEMAKQHKPDLIISDVVMSNLNGFLMLETLKEYPETADIPVIMMTSRAQKAREWKTGAAVEYPEKGYSLTQLFDTIYSILKITPQSETNP